MKKIYRKFDDNFISSITSNEKFNFTSIKNEICKFIDEKEKKEFYLKVKEVKPLEECGNCFFFKYRTKDKTFCEVECTEIKNGYSSIIFEEVDYYEVLFLNKKDGD